jgi:hypothetical protein
MRIARRVARRYGLVFVVVLVGSSGGCDSGGGGSDAPQQLAQAQPAAEEGAFRSLGKRSSFDYGDVGSGIAPQD